MWGTHLSKQKLVPLSLQAQKYSCPFFVCVSVSKMDAEPNCAGFSDAFLLVLKLVSVSEVVLCSWMCL